MKTLTFSHNFQEINLTGKSEKDIDNQLKAMRCPASARKDLLKQIKG